MLPSNDLTPLHVFCCVTGNTCIVYEKKLDLCQAKNRENLDFHKTFKLY